MRRALARMMMRVRRCKSEEITITYGGGVNIELDMNISKMVNELGYTVLEKENDVSSMQRTICCEKTDRETFDMSYRVRYA